MKVPIFMEKIIVILLLVQSARQIKGIKYFEFFENNSSKKWKTLVILLFQTL